MSEQPHHLPGIPDPDSQTRQVAPAPSPARATPSLAYSAVTEHDQPQPLTQTRAYTTSHSNEEHLGTYYGPEDKIAPVEPEPVYTPREAVARHDAGGSAAPRPPTGVQWGPFAGSVAVTTAIVVLVVWLLSWVQAAIVKWVPASYWDAREMLPPAALDIAAHAWGAVVANLVAAALLFGLIKLSIAPVSTWFTALGLLLTAVVVVVVIQGGGPWQHVLPHAVTIAVTGIVITSAGRLYGRATTIQPHNF